VEKKYGGLAEDLTVYWPPSQNSKEFLLDSDESADILISKEEYMQRKSAGLLDLYKTKNF
jgi:hypothetical protein